MSKCIGSTPLKLNFMLENVYIKQNPNPQKLNRFPFQKRIENVHFILEMAFQSPYMLQKKQVNNSHPKSYMHSITWSDALSPVFYFTQVKGEKE